MQPHVLTAFVGERSEDTLLDAIVTVDGVRIDASFRPGARPLWEHPDLKFLRTAPPDCDEIGKLFAKFHGLHFILQGNERWIIRGSLHRFANYGLHNANDFTYPMLYTALGRLEADFGLHLETCKLENLETGLNLHPWPVTRILDCILWQGNNPVQDMHMTEGDFRGADNTSYFSAYYDKGKHFKKFPEYADTLRIEKKHRNGRSFKKTGIRYLSDLRNPFCLILLADMVLDMWNTDTLFFDNALFQRLDEFKPKEREQIRQSTNLNYWKALKHRQTDKLDHPNKFRRKWRKAEEFQAQHSDLKQRISEAMAEKLLPLRRFTTEHPEKAGIYNPPSFVVHSGEEQPKGGIYTEGHSQGQHPEKGNLHGLSKVGKFPHSQPSVWDGLGGVELMDALGEDYFVPF